MRPPSLRPRSPSGSRLADPTARRVGSSSSPSSDAASGDATSGDAAPGAAGILALHIGRHGLSLQLTSPLQLGPLTAVELVALVPRVKFPLDVTGGVHRFRHKRGVLHAASLEVRVARLEAWLARQWRGLLGPGPVEVRAYVRRCGWAIAASLVSAAEDADAAIRVLAFDAEVAVDGADLCVFVHHARGTGLPAPAMALALSAASTALSPWAEREGARLRIRDPLRQVTQHVFPDAGARAPATHGVPLGRVYTAQDALVVATGEPDGAEEPWLAPLREATRLCVASDDARLSGGFDQARSLDLEALERAPRSRAIVRRIVELDAWTGGRAEAARALLDECPEGEQSGDALLRGALALEAHDRATAVAAFVRAGDLESTAPLAGASFGEAARHATDGALRLQWLDAAIARAPRLCALRWRRVAERIDAGRMQDALADLEQLEALARSPKARFEVWRKGADVFRSRRAPEAVLLYERALRFAPDDGEALAGLGQALVLGGKPARGAELLARAVDVLEAQGRPSDSARLALGRALADGLSDKPAAIARVASVPDTSTDAFEARALEARWRSELGDSAGASVAYARMRDRALGWAMTREATAARDPAREHAMADRLLEAAAFEWALGDGQQAERHAVAAARVSPGDERPRAWLERHAARPAAPPPAPPPAAPIGGDLAPAGSEADAGPEAPSSAPAESLPAEAPLLFAHLDPEARVEELSRALQNDPKNAVIAQQLADLLSELDRGLELLALLSARIEDASSGDRPALVAQALPLLERLAQDARARGKDSEAELFDGFRQQLSGGD